MACLTYFPQSVRYQGAFLTRIDLIKIKNKLINQQLEKLLSNENYAPQLHALQNNAINEARSISQANSRRPSTAGYHNHSRRNLSSAKMSQDFTLMTEERQTGMMLYRDKSRVGSGNGTLTPIINE